MFIIKPNGKLYTNIHANKKCENKQKIYTNIHANTNK